MDFDCSRLNELLSSSPSDRTARAYEEVFDEFIAGAGGIRIEQLIKSANLSCNADYTLEFDRIEAVLELKQVHKQTHSIPDVARQLIAAGRISSGVSKLNERQVAVSPRDMTLRDRNRLYARWGRTFDDKLKDANVQIRDISKRLPVREQGPRLGGVVFLNTGNYQFSTDRMSNILGVFLRRQWNAGRYRHIDFAISLAIDLFSDVRNPLNGGAIGRPALKECCHPFLKNLLDAWTSYLSSGFGRTMSPEMEYLSPLVVDDIPFKGKVRLIEG